MSDRYIADLLPAAFFEELKNGNIDRRHYPVFADRAAWEKAAQSPLASAVIAKADAVSPECVPPLLYSNYVKFNINGNRSEYEAPYFKRREDLGHLAAALCLSGDKAKYMPRLMDVLMAILEEWSWCLPAHFFWQEQLSQQRIFCDLFCAETGAALAYIHALLGDELEKELAGLPELLRRRILERTTYTLFANEECHKWYTAERPHNWTPWCSSNLIAVALLLEEDTRKLALHVERLLERVSRFISVYSDDGYCAEGPLYYNKAALTAFRAVERIEKSVPGSCRRIFSDPKFRAMLEFIGHMQIGERYQVSFADANAGFTPAVGAVGSAGRLIGSPVLRSIAARMECAPDQCNVLQEFLSALFDWQDAAADNDQVTVPELTFFRDRLAVMRSSRFSASLKGGHNREPHNHNDLGHFTLFHGDEAVIVDAGFGGSYTREYFMPEKRFRYWNAGGRGHNAPVFGEYEQLYGEEYRASLEIEGSRMISDLSCAYPAEAGVRRFIRTLDFSPERVVVSDDLQLRELSDTVITLLTPLEPEVIDRRTIRLGSAVTLRLEGMEYLPERQMPEIFRQAGEFVIPAWQGRLTALRLTADAAAYRLIFEL